MTATDTTPANDITTVFGWIAEYKAQVRNLAHAFRWCAQGTHLAYEKAGLDYEGNLQEADPVTLVPAELLNDDGRARLDASQATTVAALKEGAIKAAKYGIETGYGPDEINAALKALGVAPLQQVSYHDLYITIRTGTAERTGPKGLLTTVTRDMVAKAVSEVLAARDVTTTIPLVVEASSARGVTRTYATADAPAAG